MPNAQPRGAAERRPLPDEMVSLVRGFCGGALFAVPILYTMEVWWLGQTLQPAKTLGFLACGYAFAVALNFLSGYREELVWREVFADGLVALGLGVGTAALLLATLGVLSSSRDWRVPLTQIGVLAVPIAVGVSLARSQLTSGGPAVTAESREEALVPAALRDLAVTAIGGVFLGLSVAPTQEIPTILTQSRLPNLLATMAISLAVTYAMVFVADFGGQAARRARGGALQSPWGETVVSYALSLGVAWGLLAFLGYLEGHTSPYDRLAMTVVLGLPVALGGAAGRLIL